MPFDIHICEKLGIMLWFEGSAFDIYLIASVNPSAKEFVEGLETGDQSSYHKSLALLEKVKDHPQILKNPEKSGALEDGLFEFKPTDQVRLPYFYDKDSSLIITHGFIKKRNKTKRADIDKAKQLRNEYFKKKKELNL